MLANNLHIRTICRYNCSVKRSKKYNLKTEIFYEKTLLVLCTTVFLFASCKDKSNAQSFSFSKVYTVDELNIMLDNFYGMESIDVNQPEMVVIEKFKIHFPEAYGLDWETGNELCLVEFKVKNIDYEAVYDKQGDLLMCIYDIPKSDIPEVIKRTVENGDYKDWRIDEVKKMATFYETQYRIKLEKGEKEVKVFFDADGDMIAANPK